MGSGILVVIGSATVLLGLATSILGLINARQSAAAARAADTAAAKAALTARKVQSISVNVDGRLTELFERQAQLLGALHRAGVPVPPPPAKTGPAIPAGPGKE
jgi:hypothetical protein